MCFKKIVCTNLVLTMTVLTTDPDSPSIDIVEAGLNFAGVEEESCRWPPILESSVKFFFCEGKIVQTFVYFVVPGFEQFVRLSKLQWTTPLLDLPSTRSSERWRFQRWWQFSSPPQFEPVRLVQVPGRGGRRLEWTGLLSPLLAVPALLRQSLHLPPLDFSTSRSTTSPLC